MTKKEVSNYVKDFIIPNLDLHFEWTRNCSNWELNYEYEVSLDDGSILGFDISAEAVVGIDPGDWDIPEYCYVVDQHIEISGLTYWNEDTGTVELSADKDLQKALISKIEIQ